MKTLEERFWPKVRKTQGCWAWTGALGGGGHGQIRGAEKLQYAHRVSYEIANGPIPAGMVIDHACHNRSCVNPAHLRLATLKQNAENLAGPRANTASGIRGVSWHKQAQKWNARLMHAGQHINLGLFSTREEARAVVLAKRLELFTHNQVDRNDIITDSDTADLFNGDNPTTLRSAA